MFSLTSYVKIKKVCIKILYAERINVSFNCRFLMSIFTVFDEIITRAVYD